MSIHQASVLPSAAPKTMSTSMVSTPDATNKQIKRAIFSEACT